MASNCCGTKKQKMNNQQCNMNGQMNNHGKTNGFSSTSSTLMNHHANSHNGVCSNGYNGVEQVANPEMCFFCFEVLYRELYRLDDAPEPNFTNEAL